MPRFAAREAVVEALQKQVTFSNSSHNIYNFSLIVGLRIFVTLWVVACKCLVDFNCFVNILFRGCTEVPKTMK